MNAGGRSTGHIRRSRRGLICCSCRRCGLARGCVCIKDLPDEPYLLRIIRSTVSAEHVVKPRRGFAGKVGMFPGIPRKIRLRLACDQPPVDGTDMVFLENWHRVLKGTTVAACHVFGAQNRAVAALKRQNPPPHLIRTVVGME